MKAVVKTKPERGAELLDIPKPTIGPDDILVKVLASAICGTDVHIYNWSQYAQTRVPIPMAFGHEFSGLVEEVGARVTNVKPGDMMAAETHLYCGECYQCQMGNIHICEKMKIIGVHVPGSFAEYIAMPANIAWKLAPGTSPEAGAVLEPLGVAVHGALVDRLDLKSVAVFGCGPIGVFATQVAAAAGCAPLFVLDVNDWRLNFAKQIVPSAIPVNVAKVDAVKEIKAATGGRGVDVSIELSGTAAATKQCFDVLRIGGRVSLTGLTNGTTDISTTDQIVYKEAQIYGTTGRLMWKTWWEMDNLLCTGKVDPTKVITHRFALEDFEKAFAQVFSGEAGKVLLIP